MTSKFSGKVALVTGGTGGLGRAVTLALLHEGASVIATYIKKDESDALKDVVGPTPHLELLPLDATDETACRALVDGITARHGHLDILVNAIGGFAGGKALWETAPKTYQLMLTLNLHAGYNLARTVVPAMLRQKSGAIINIASKAALDHAAGASAYAASKAATLALFDSLAQDVKGSGVRVNSVLPSIIDTEPNRKAMPNADFSKWPKPEQIAQVILFLCSDEAKVVHGAAIPVYGES
ncbi:MAG: SDR family NAD(P)-dependent oxidoreductase [Acidobacteriia bacterium]|nr:SDR family NAD(P)-dependent oxidoreductase [Terriglobia bacterium]